MNDKVEIIRETLYPEEGGDVFVVLDGASVPGLLQELADLEPEHECLYRGELTPDLAEVAPYLIHLPPTAQFTEWVLEQGWGKHWGVFAESKADLRTLRQHFRKLLTVYDPNAKPMLFRYYDPRVLRVFLPTCNAEELASMYGPIDSYYMEDEDPKSMLRFRNRDGSLDKKQISLEAGVAK